MRGWMACVAGAGLVLAGAALADEPNPLLGSWVMSEFSPAACHDTGPAGEGGMTFTPTSMVVRQPSGRVDTVPVSYDVNGMLVAVTARGQTRTFHIKDKHLTVDGDPYHCILARK